jgi:hypothetical protein
LYQSTIAPTGKPDESEREGTERIDDDQQIVRDALPEYWRRGLLSQISQFSVAAKPDQSLPRHSSAANEGKVAPPRQAGEIIATQRIELGPFAKVLGKLAAPHLVVHKGAMFEGRCTMRSERSCEDRKAEDRKVIVFSMDEHAAAHLFGFIWISRSEKRAGSSSSRAAATNY